MSRIDDAEPIDRLAAQFAQLDSVMPSFRVGLKQHQLARAVQATSMARAYVSDRRRGLAVLVPWRAIAAWQLSEQERIISYLSLLQSTSVPAERARLMTELSQRGPLSGAVLPGTFDAALSQQDWLLHTLHASRTVVALQQSYARHGEYPATAPQDSARDVEYERTNVGKGYRLRIRSETGELVPFLERKPDESLPQTVVRVP